MADSSITTGDIEIILPEGAEDSLEIVELEIGTELAVTAPVNDLEVTVSGDSALVGKPVTNSSVTVEASSSQETVTLALNTNSFKKSDIVVEKGAAEINVNVGTFKKSTVTGGDQGDSVKFGSKSKVNKATVNLGEGGDTVTFKTTAKKSTVDMGNDNAADSVVVKNGAKKLTLDNFGDEDSLTIGGKTFDRDDIENGADIGGVKVNLA